MARQLYSFFRSGSSHRLRIALNLKGIDYDYIAIDLRTEEHLGEKFKAINPQGLVPVLVDDGQILIQSPAIIEWLEERYPTPALLPSVSADRAKVRAMAAIIGCDIHPLNNRRVLEYLRKTMKCDETAVIDWCATWITAGFETLERMLAADQRRGQFCFGDVPTLADAYLLPQVESAMRFKIEMTPYPNIMQVVDACSELDAFRRASPKIQPDAA